MYGQEYGGEAESIIGDAGDLRGEMAGNYAVNSQISEKYTGDFIKLKDSMAEMRDQMNHTLHGIPDKPAFTECFH